MRSELAETGKASTKYCIVIEVGNFWYSIRHGAFISGSKR